MTITVKHISGYEFSDKKYPITEIEVFSNRVDFDRFVRFKKEFDAEDEIISVHFDCK
jgi:hypothetical protein